MTAPAPRASAASSAAATSGTSAVAGSRPIASAMASADAVPQVKRRQAGVGKATMLPTTYCDDLTVDNYRLELGS